MHHGAERKEGRGLFCPPCPLSVEKYCSSSGLALRPRPAALVSGLLSVLEAELSRGQQHLPETRGLRAKSVSLTSSARSVAFQCSPGFSPQDPVL